MTDFNQTESMVNDTLKALWEDMQAAMNCKDVARIAHCTRAIKRAEGDLTALHRVFKLLGVDPQDYYYIVYDGRIIK